MKGRAGKVLKRRRVEGKGKHTDGREKEYREGGGLCAGLQVIGVIGGQSGLGLERSNKAVPEGK